MFKCCLEDFSGRVLACAASVWTAAWVLVVIDLVAAPQRDPLCLHYFAYTEMQTVVCKVNLKLSARLADQTSTPSTHDNRQLQ
jgi:hypothetical protein